MSSPALCRMGRALLPCALALALFVPAGHGRAAQKLKVDVHVTVHNSDIGVSQETLDDLVEELLEEADFQVEKEKADSAAVQVKIDIYRTNGKFKVVGDLDDPKDDDDDADESDEEKETEAQDQIDDLVTAIVRDFIKMLRSHHS